MHLGVRKSTQEHEHDREREREHKDKVKATHPKGTTIQFSSVKTTRAARGIKTRLPSSTLANLGSDAKQILAKGNANSNNNNNNDSHSSSISKALDRDHGSGSGTYNAEPTEAEASILFHYDLNSNYGPCIGIQRSERLARAYRNGFQNEELASVKHLLTVYASIKGNPIEASIWSNVL